jgi:hypothetical protein
MAGRCASCGILQASCERRISDWARAPKVIGAGNCGTPLGYGPLLICARYPGCGRRGDRILRDGVERLRRWGEGDIPRGVRSAEYGVRSAAEGTGRICSGTKWGGDHFSGRLIALPDDGCLFGRPRARRVYSRSSCRATLERHGSTSTTLPATGWSIPQPVIEPVIESTPFDDSGRATQSLRE